MKKRINKTPSSGRSSVVFFYSSHNTNSVFKTPIASKTFRKTSDFVPVHAPEPIPRVVDFQSAFRLRRTIYYTILPWKITYFDVLHSPPPKLNMLDAWVYENVRRRYDNLWHLWWARLAATAVSSTMSGQNTILYYGDRLVEQRPGPPVGMKFSARARDLGYSRAANATAPPKCKNR